MFIFNWHGFCVKKAIRNISLFFILLFLGTDLFAADKKITLKSDGVLRIKSIGEFKFVAPKKEGIEDGGVYTLKNGDNAKYLIKFIDKAGVINEFVGAFILRKIIGDRAPLNYIVRMEDGEIAIASRFIEDFISLRSYMKSYDLFYMKPSFVEDFLYKIRNRYRRWYEPSTFIYLERARSLSLTKLFWLKEMVELQILAKFIKYRDFNAGNIGFVIRDNEIENSAIVDFNGSLIGEWVGGFIPKYFFGIDDAIETFRLIKNNFTLDSLEELDALFGEIDAQEVLDDIKGLMREQLIDCDNQIKYCEIAKGLIFNNDDIENFDVLIEMEAPLSSFRTGDKGNILMNVLYRKEDVGRIVKAFGQDKELIRGFIADRLKHCEYELCCATIIFAGWRQLRLPVS